MTCTPYWIFKPGYGVWNTSYNGTMTRFVRTVITLLLLLLGTAMLAKGGRVKDFRYSTPAPRFLQTEDTYTYHKGERAILYCSVKYLGTKTVSWRRANESYFLTIGTLPMTSDPRFEVAHIEDSPDWNMMISNVTTTDSGMYECQISSRDRYLRKEVFLHVKDEFSYAEPRITITGSLHPDRGTQLLLMCNASGAITPPESIDWFKDGIKIVPDGQKKVEMRKKLSINSRTITSILTKSSTEMTDTGTYSCRTSDLQVTSVKVNVLNTNKKSQKREPDDGKASYTLDSGSSASQMSTSLILVSFCLTLVAFVRNAALDTY
ncbi:zwei Ig domain protein zig-8-like [Mya arenaria]|uniref:zwei Ig domain protein zig-8-like n=1 Tax=Mya arenaria TaxID=6604 RepID=UPI0022E1397A|nr:zwei Ig domain protein zig-8-like [Mya arenaria]XP_052795642.1 zwei Ig domain protein zig-8-like [Mya arenaria]XP_052795643.1 zwei Ig domain protein zig-8-like [Mya arenaria]XP_052795644.1 zwei Ig domain protein zig-8-like [Mya arenaria]